MSVIPLPLLHRIARLWGKALYHGTSRARTTTETNLKACFPEKSSGDIQALTRQSLTNTACTALEMGKSWMPPIEKTLALVVEEQGVDKLREAVREGNGVILVAPHLSNWELLGFYVAEEIPATFMYQPPKIPAFDRLLKKARTRTGGIRLAPTNRKGVAQVLGAIKKGELIGILPDQVPADESGVYADFFGNQAFTMTLISKLVTRSEARVFCGFAQRLDNGKGFKVIIEEADADIYHDDINISVRGLNKTVEKTVELAVAQYQWEYKRFRRQADGKKFY